MKILLVYGGFAITIIWRIVLSFIINQTDDMARLISLSLILIVGISNEI